MTSTLIAPNDNSTESAGAEQGVGRPILEEAPAARSEGAVTPAPPIGFGAAQARVMPAAMLGVFLLASIGLNVYNGESIGAVGLAAYLAMWLGGGFGFLGGGILWAIDHERYEAETGGH